MRAIPIPLCVLLVAAMMCLAASAAEVSVASQDEENLPDLVDRGFNLTRLSIFHDPKEPLDPETAAMFYLSFLREEIDSPTPAHRGIGGGKIDHHYVLAQIVHAGADGNASRRMLLEELKKAPPGEFRDAIRITLGMQGGKSVVPFLMEYLGNTKNPYSLRQKAADALLRHPDPAAIPVLAQCLNDPFYVASTSGPFKKLYDIRLLALNTLRALEKAGTPIPPAVKSAMERAVTQEPYPPGVKPRSYTNP